MTDLANSVGEGNVAAPLETGAAAPAPQAAPAAASEASAPPPAADPAAAPAAAAAPVIDPATGKPAAPAWQPNFKVKSYDKEFEIDELFRGLIKDAETEKKVKEVFEKAYAIDVMKPKYQKAREENEKLRGSVEKEYQPLAKAVDEISALYAKGAASGELEGFFQKLQIPDEVLFKYVARRLDYTQLTPEQKAAYDRSVQAQSQTYQLEQQNQQLQAEVQTHQVQARTFEMNTVLAKPEVKEIADIVDSRLGPGTFQNEVIREGILAWKTQQKDLSAEEAATAVLNRIRPIVQAQLPPQGAGAQNPAAQRPPVIPTLKGQGTSPVKQMPKSIADLKKIAASMGS